MAQQKHAAFFEVRDALSECGCPICRLAARSVRRFMDTLLYENVNDPGVRGAVRGARGFCNAHAWQLQAIGGALGLALIHRDVLITAMVVLEQSRYRVPALLSRQRVQNVLNDTRPAAATAETVAQLAPQQPCPACDQQRQMEDVYLSTLLEHLSEADLRDALQAAGGLCTPHLRRALQLVRDETTYQALCETQLAAWKSLKAELDEFIRKHDYRFASEPMGEEGDSWTRAIAAVSSREGVPWGCHRDGSDRR